MLRQLAVQQQSLAVRPLITQASLDLDEDEPPKRSAPFDTEPGYYAPVGLWFYGNARLLDSKLAYIKAATGPERHRPSELDDIERQAEEAVLQSHTLVCGVHSAAHQRPSAQRPG